MSPAFSSRAQALGFLSLLLFALGLPWLMARLGSEPPRSELYQTIPPERGAFSFIHQQIFEERGDIDILFVGDSILWDAFHPRILARMFREQTGREPVIRVLGYNWRQEDMIHVLLRDLIQQRRVKLLVTNMPNETHRQKNIHHQAYRWLRYSEIAELTAGLPASYLPQFYGETVLGAPRQWLSAIRRNRVERPIALEKTNGYLAHQEGFRGRPYIDRRLTAPAFAAQALLYSPSTKDEFDFGGEPLNTYQLHFIRKTFSLLRDAGVPTVILHVPRAAERGAERVKERMPWNVVLGTDFPIVGISPSKLFHNLSEEDVLALYYDGDHLNSSGSAFVTRALAAPLIFIYEQNEKKTGLQAAARFPR